MKYIVESSSLEEIKELKRKLTDCSVISGRCYPYFYEGAGERKLYMMPGRHTNAIWDTLTWKQKFAIGLGSADLTEEEKAAVSAYVQALEKDFEENGGYTAVKGDPSKAVWVFEYETKSGD
jgi:hypothetical protein